MYKITAVIPIRKGSQRVKNKNLRTFCNTNLLELKINNLKKVSNIDEIIVNTDSDEAIQIAINNKVNFHIREEYFASSHCNNSDFLEHLGVVTNTDFIAYCPCTSPFIKPRTIENLINYFMENNNIFDSLATTCLVKEFLWLDNNPLNYERGNQPNSQNLPNIKALNFGLNLISRENLIRYKNIVGEMPYLKNIDKLEGFDIDTPFDFFLAEKIYEKLMIDSDFLNKY
jgi:CMP-N-acetylneuraminic acid synthetase